MTKQKTYAPHVWYNSIHVLLLGRSGCSSPSYKELYGWASMLRLMGSNLERLALVKVAILSRVRTYRPHIQPQNLDSTSEANNFILILFFSAPPSFEIKKRTQTALISENTVLQCEAKGEKPIGVLWNKDNKRLEANIDPRSAVNKFAIVSHTLTELFIHRDQRNMTFSDCTHMNEYVIICT